MTQGIGTTAAATELATAGRAPGHLFDRPVARLRGVFGRRATWWPGGASRSAGPRSAPALEARIADCLQDRGGEMAARGRAAALGRWYLRSSDVERADALALLAERFGCERERVDVLLRAALAATDGTDRERALAQLRRGLVAPRVELFRRCGSMEGGIRFLVDLRSDVRRFRPERPVLAPLDEELKALLAEWFDLGLLELERVDWNALAPLLEKLIAYEAVHPIAVRQI